MRRSARPATTDWLHRAEERGRQPLSRTYTAPAAPPRLGKKPLPHERAPSMPSPGAEATAIRYPYGITDYADLLAKINALGGSDPFTAPVQVNAPVPASTTDPLLLVGEDPLVGGSADGTVIGSNQPVTFEGDFINFQIDGDTVFKVEFDGDLFAREGHFTITDGVNTGPADPLVISHRLSAGAAASGFGVRLLMMGEDDGGGEETFGIMVARATNTTDAALSTTIEWQVRANGSVTTPIQLRGSPTLSGIQCNEILEAQQGLGIVFASASALGALSGVFEVFDAFTQVSRGYVPCYASFTP